MIISTGISVAAGQMEDRERIGAVTHAIGPSRAGKRVIRRGRREEFLGLRLVQHDHLDHRRAARAAEHEDEQKNVTILHYKAVLYVLCPAAIAELLGRV